MRTHWGIVLAVLILGGVSPASAGFVSELEPNNSIAGAQNIDAFFTQYLSSGMGDLNGNNTSASIPHVTIGATGDNTFDYFSFTVANAGDLGIFDIDNGMQNTQGDSTGSSLDTELFLYTTAGTLLAQNDDTSATAGAGGSIHHYDAFIQHTFATAGTYVIGVGRYNAVGFTGGITGDRPLSGDSYLLNISIENHEVSPSAVPEPSSLALLGTGLVSLVGYGWRRKRQSVAAA